MALSNYVRGRLELPPKPRVPRGPMGPALLKYTAYGVSAYRGRCTATICGKVLFGGKRSYEISVPLSTLREIVAEAEKEQAKDIAEMVTELEKFESEKLDREIAEDDEKIEREIARASY